MPSDFPLVRFFSLMPNAPLPAPADPTVVGSASLRACRDCVPFSAASGFGWYLYPPIDFDIQWDGRAVEWRRVDGTWAPVRVVVLPEVAAAVPAKFGLRDSFPFLSGAPEHGILQIWPCIVAQSPEGWSMLVRALANYPRDPAYEVLDGIIETDWWVGPLLSPIRLLKSDRVIEFRRHRPYAQVQLVHRTAYQHETMTRAVGSHELPDDIGRGLALTTASLSDRSNHAYKKGVRARRQRG